MKVTSEASRALLLPHDAHVCSSRSSTEQEQCASRRRRVPAASGVLFALPADLCNRTFSSQPDMSMLCRLKARRRCHWRCRRMSPMTRGAFCPWGGTATQTPGAHPSPSCWALHPTWIRNTPSSGETVKLADASLCGNRMSRSCVVIVRHSKLCKSRQTVHRITCPARLISGSASSIQHLRFACTDKGVGLLMLKGGFVGPGTHQWHWSTVKTRAQKGMMMFESIVAL